MKVASRVVERSCFNKKKKVAQAQHNNSFQDGQDFSPRRNDKRSILLEVGRDGGHPVLLESYLRVSIILSYFHLALRNNVLLILVGIQAKHNSLAWVLLAQAQAGIIANWKYLSSSGERRGGKFYLTEK